MKTYLVTGACQLHKILTKQKVSESRYKGIDTR